LAARATELARAGCGSDDVEILWDGGWVRRIGSVYFPEPELFSGVEPNWSKWMDQEAKHLRDADDYWFHVYKPRAGDVIVDIGAGRGEDTFAFSRGVGPAGRVWAIEPHPQTFRILSEFCRLNRLDNVNRLNFACTEAPAELQIETMPVWESNYVRGGEQTPTSFPVTGIPFDRLAEQQGIDRIDFLKMNIEGAERMALPGCTEALRRARMVCVAAHDFRANRGEGEPFRTFDEVCATLRRAGFTLTLRQDDPRYYVPYHVHGVRA